MTAPAHPAAAPAAAAPAASTQSSAAASAAQQAALNRLLAKYKSEISSNPNASDLGSLGKQITAAAKALGQHVTLPTASGSSAPAPAPTQPAATSAPTASSPVNVKA